MGERFDGKVVAITGGAGGIGLATALAFGRAGARVAVLDIAGLEEARARLGAAGFPFVALRCDITDPESCQSAVAAVAEALGGLDVLVNNAGVGQRSEFATTNLGVFRRVMEVNFFGALHATHAALPQLIARRGVVVVVSSVAGFAPLFGRSGYAASKHALHGLFDSARAELAPHGVGVSIVCPSFTESSFEARTLGADGEPVRRPRSMVGRLATPESVAAGIVQATAGRHRLAVLAPVGKLTRLMTRLWPALYERLMARSLRGELAPPPGP